MALCFYTIDIPHPRFERKKLKAALIQLIETHKREPGDLDVIFCSDEELLKMNRKYLEHDFYTDVITFDYSADNIVNGDIFVSIDRIRENAKKNNISTQIEIRRIVGHGVLHLIGFNDKTFNDKEVMTREEEKFLKVFE